MDNRADDDVESNSKALNEIEVIMYGNVNWWSYFMAKYRWLRK
jgi:hypothetical protein